MDRLPILFLLILLVSFSLSPHLSFSRRISHDDVAISACEYPASEADGGFVSHLALKSDAQTPEAAAEEEKCEETYGFLPCTTTVFGNLFLTMAYGFLMFKAATYLSAGSELLLEILGPGIIGGLFLPILGALPDALLILVSGLSGSKETAQSQVLIGIGLLAGSTVMLLTILWGSCIIVAKTDLSENSTSIDLQDTKRFSIFGSGVTTDIQTSYAARIMALSVLPFVIVQLPRVFRFPSGQRLMVLIAFIASVLLVISYCLYQVFQPWIQKRRLAYAKHKHVISGILRHAQKEALGKLLNDEGEPNVPAIKKLFRKIDLDSSNSLSQSELRAFVIGVQFDEVDLDKDDAVEKVMADFDRSGDADVDETEFIAGMSRWIQEAIQTVGKSDSYSKKFVHDFHMKTKQEHNMLVDKPDEAVEAIENVKWVWTKALLLLVLGTVMAAVFADPLVDAVHNFSVATKIPSFFISFIAMPLATNSSEAVSALIFASRKKQRTSSLTFSEVYGGVTMNNTLCLAVFCALVYARGLTWDFSSEALIILLVCLIMGAFTSFRTTFPLWSCFVAYALYPLSLLIVYILDYKFGWQ